MRLCLCYYSVARRSSSDRSEHKLVFTRVINISSHWKQPQWIFEVVSIDPIKITKVQNNEKLLITYNTVSS